VTKDYKPLVVEELPDLWIAFKNRQQDRDDRNEIISRVVAGDYCVEDDNEEEIENRSVNLIQVALEDTSESASLMPTLRVVPGRSGAEAKKQASRMEKIGAGYFDVSKMDLLIPQTVLKLAAFGLGCWVVWPDEDLKMPVFELRDSQTCYPEPGFRPGYPTERCIFAREVYYSQLPADFKVKVENFVQTDERGDRIDTHNTKVVLAEWFDCKQIVQVALFEIGGKDWYGGKTDVGFLPIELERYEHGFDITPVVIGSRFSLDGEFRGQFDQTVGMQKALVKLQGMVYDYADQAVYSDLWVRDPMGEVPFGGGTFIELGPNGAIGRVPPAVSSLDVQRDLEALMNSMHLGGRYPQSRPGEIDQSIASAKFLESAAGMMNTAIRTYHQILKRMMEQALRIAFLIDKKKFPSAKMTAGVLRNQEFCEEYTPSKDIDLKHRVRIEYGLGLGRSPSETSVLMLQYAAPGNEYISREFVQENIDGLTDVERERRRVDIQRLRDMMFAKIMQGIEAKEIPDSALVDIIDAREKGDDMSAIFRKYVVEPQQAAMDQGMQSGLTGELLAPGGEQAFQGVPGMPAAPPGAQVPPAPGGTDLISRLTSALPEGGFIGSQQTSA